MNKTYKVTSDYSIFKEGERLESAEHDAMRPWPAHLVPVVNEKTHSVGWVHVDCVEEVACRP